MEYADARTRACTPAPARYNRGMHDPAKRFQGVPGTDDSAALVRTAKAYGIFLGRACELRDADEEELRAAFRVLDDRVKRTVQQITRTTDSGVKGRISKNFLDRIRSVQDNISGISYCKAAHDALNTYCNENPEAMPIDGA